MEITLYPRSLPVKMWLWSETAILHIFFSLFYIKNSWEGQPRWCRYLSKSYVKFICKPLILYKRDLWSLVAYKSLDKWVTTPFFPPSFLNLSVFFFFSFSPPLYCLSFFSQADTYDVCGGDSLPPMKYSSRWDRLAVWLGKDLWVLIWLMHD